MNRQQLIEKICSIIFYNDSEETKRLANEILNDLVSNKISEDKAKILIDKLLSNSYWSSVNLPKSLYDNLKKFKKDKLTEIQTIKMVSSIITRCLIEIEYKPDISKSETGIYDFLHYLNYKIKGSPEEVDLYKLLVKYGFLESEEGVTDE